MRLKAERRGPAQTLLKVERCGSARALLKAERCGPACAWLKAERCGPACAWLKAERCGPARVGRVPTITPIGVDDDDDVDIVELERHGIDEESEHLEPEVGLRAVPQPIQPSEEECRACTAEHILRYG